jgi:hypothetical protein
VSHVYAKSGLDPRELQLLDGEMHRREKSIGIAFVLWILAGTLFLHRVYLGRGNAGLVAGIIWWSLWIFGLFTLIFLIGFLLLLIAFVMSIVLFIIWLIDAFSITKWVDEYNSNLEVELINQLLAARGGGMPNPYAPGQGQPYPAIAVNVAASSGAPAQAYGSAPIAAYQPAPAVGAGASSGRMTYVESGRPSTVQVAQGDQIVVGRDPSARIRLSDPKVSRQHCVVSRSGNDWVVRDLGATNPTRLLGSGGAAQTVQGEVRVASGQLLIGDVLVTLFPTGA